MDTAAIPAPPAPNAVSATNRLLAIDVTRGFALLGIFLVNIQSFGEPFGHFLAPFPESDDALTVLCYYFVRIFCEGKFYPLFSMLFGMGLALQMHSVMSRGGNFYAIYARRLAWLFLMGLSHALLLWYGDILFLYSIAGLVLLLCARIDPRTLLSIGIALALFGAVLQSGFAALTGVAASQIQSAASSPRHTEATGEDPPPAPRSPIRQVLDGYPRGPESPDWLEGEMRAYREGPWLQSFSVRALSWAMCLLVAIVGYGWHILGMFFVGGALLRLGLFTAEGERWHTSLLLLGLLVGLPGNLVSALLPQWLGHNALSAGLSTLLLMVCGPMVSMFYLMAFTLLVRQGLATPVTWTLANVGRMALTNYLSQTVIATFVFYHWGFAQFATWTRPERCAMVLAVFACQCLVSVVWLRIFRFGPMEWLWRTVTYLKPQPMLRTRGGPEPV